MYIRHNIALRCSGIGGVRDSHTYHDLFVYSICVYIYIYICIYILYVQGVPGGLCETSGECSLC
jgi:hypothetical protein